jgi:hypothetical protein
VLVSVGARTDGATAELPEASLKMLSSLSQVNSVSRSGVKRFIQLSGETEFCRYLLRKHRSGMKFEQAFHNIIPK